MNSKTELEKLVRNKRAYCEDKYSFITLRQFYTCKCYESRHGLEFCPYFSEVRRLKGRIGK